MEKVSGSQITDCQLPCHALIQKVRGTIAKIRQRLLGKWVKRCNTITNLINISMFDYRPTLFYFTHCHHGRKCPLFDPLNPRCSCIWWCCPSIIRGLCIGLKSFCNQTSFSIQLDPPGASHQSLISHAAVT
mmetsp:Transcript_8201/g.20166  ORF Transcript_8201/g.20166 Transcript_8201/m.20166 type:complete len:131 (-) Transcript_8201:2595-2987(-)